ncbi:MAG: NHL repeat-containing protein [Nitrospirota bacterium]|nr:NHL repeat-containing protein [Nitrospirota bacterium]
MTKILLTAVFVLALVLPAAKAPAATAKLLYTATVYADGKNVGMKKPEGVACGNLLIVADSGNGRLLKYTVAEGELKEGTEIKIPEMPQPINVRVTAKGEILALDAKQRRIVRLGPEGEFRGYISPEGVPSPSSFIPRSFTTDSDDNIYILDIFSSRVLTVDPAGKYLRHTAFPEAYGFISDIAVDQRGTMYLLDSVKLMVYSAVKDAKGFTPLTKEMREEMYFPNALTVDSKGVIYVVDKNGGSIVTIGADGSFQGRNLSFGWKEGLLHYPSNICVNDRDEAFIADTDNNRVQMFKVIR